MNHIFHATLFYTTAVLLALSLWAALIWLQCDRPRSRHFWRNYLFSIVFIFLLTPGVAITTLTLFFISWLIHNA